MTPDMFSKVTAVTDPLLAERLVSALKATGVEAFSRAGGAASSDPLGSADRAIFDIMVPSDALSKADALVRTELAELKSNEEANAQAAEEEAMGERGP